MYLMLKEIHRVEILVVSDFLQFSRIDTVEWKPASEVLDIRSLVQDSVEDARLNAEEKGIGLEYVGPDGDILVAADARLIGRVIDNLLDNALRYTKPEGTERVAYPRAMELL